MNQPPNTEIYSPDTLPENIRGKKVVLVNHSDTLGGAAIVTFRLMQAMRQIGVDARMVVFTKTSEEETISDIYSCFIRSMAFVMERLSMLPALGFKKENLFKISTGDFALNIHHHPWVKEADIVCLNWVNQGLMNVKGIRKLHHMGKKIVWTIHDMWTMTGVCHHAYECDRYLDECGNCRFLSGGGRKDDISHKCWEKKLQVYNEVPMTYITVSKWLEDCARHSSLLRGRDILTINNPFPIEQFYTTPPRDLYSLMPPHKPNILLFGAARIDDPIKGLDYTIDALNHIFDNYPEIANKTAVYFFGNIKKPQALDRLRFSHRHFGLVRDFKVIRYLYSIAKVVISTSLYETLGGTLVEGQAGGALPVTFGIDGRTDIVEHMRTGYIARYKDPIDVANGILWALKADISREYLHQTVADRFAAPIIASKYADVFSRILNHNSSVIFEQA